MKRPVVNIYEDRLCSCILTAEQRQELMSLEPLWGSQNFLLRADDRLLLQRYVGFVSTPNLRLQILPKLFRDQAHENEEGTSVAMLFRLLHYSGFLAVRELPSSQLMASFQHDMLELFIHLFLVRFLGVFERHVHRHYEDKTDNVQFVKGKILFQQSLERNYGLRHLHMVAYQEFTEDTLLNQVLKSVMILIGKKTSHADNKKKLAQALTYLEDVRIIRLSSQAFDAVRFNRMNEAYRPVLNMARMFYTNAQPGMRAGDDQVFSFLVPLNRLFEQFVNKLLNRALANIYKVQYQEQAYLDRQSKRFVVKPDFVLRGINGKNNAIHEAASIVADAKYKNPITPSGELKPTESDLYQMMAYALKFQVSTLLLIYPKFVSEPNVKAQTATYRIDAGERDVSLHLLQLDLLESKMEELERRLREQILGLELNMEMNEIRTVVSDS
ncbi:McrC family protein [Paenibacillus chungangensis]|uniref:McrC family protein n=1 Tax=Paenibacillus chungangensis TaxID=696535 RepID=A0ABW3HSS9_9BACL